MRLRAWSGKPPLKPPLLGVPPNHVPPYQATQSLTPAPFSLPPAPKPILRARRAADHRLQGIRSSSKNPKGSSRRQLGQVLASLPPISGSALQPPLSLRLDQDVEQDLRQWRMACWTAHAILSGPLRDSHVEFRNKVARIVAHTIRLLIRVKMYSTARELDRAFFSEDDPPDRRHLTQRNLPSSERLSGGSSSASGRGKRLQRATLYELYPLGKGLGIKRGSINVAWMQSLSLRLQTDGRRWSADEFGHLLETLKTEQSEEGVNPHILAFLLRQGELLQRKLEEEGWHTRQAKREVRKVMDSIRADPRTGSDNVVRMAWIETTMVELEQVMDRRRNFNDKLFARLETEVRKAVGGLRDLEDGQLTHAVHETIIAPAPQTAVDVDQRAQILHIAIRFLLLQGHRAHELSQERRIPVFRRSLASAVKVYTSIVDLIALASASELPVTTMHKLRQRQTSCLVRIAWASVRASDFSTHPPGQWVRNAASEEDATLPADLPTIHQLLEAVDLTLRAARGSRSPNDISSGAPKPATPFGISTHFWRRLLYTLTLPSSPSRRAPPYAPASRPPWPLLRRALSLILQCRQHDTALQTTATSLHTTASMQRPTHFEPMFIRTSFILHLVRAVLVGGPKSVPPSPMPRSVSELSSVAVSPTADSIRDSCYGSSSAAAAATTALGPSSPRARLEFLLDWIGAMERTSWPHDGSGREVVRRTVVRSAVEEVLRQEWEGVALAEWRKDMREIVRVWQETGAQPVSSLVSGGRA